MACKNSCRLCNNLIISTAVNYDAGTNTVIIGLPAGTYNDDCKYCIVIAQAIPTTAQISSNVAISIGTGLQQYPLVDCNGVQVTACGIRTRTKYSTVVETSSTSGVFRMLGKACCQPNNNLTGINGTAPVA